MGEGFDMSSVLELEKMMVMANLKTDDALAFATALVPLLPSLLLLFLILFSTSFITYLPFSFYFISFV